MDYVELYANNRDFRRYVDRHCMLYCLTKTEALAQKLVQLVGDYYAAGVEE